MKQITSLLLRIHIPMGEEYKQNFKKMEEKENNAPPCHFGE